MQRSLCIGLFLLITIAGQTASDTISPQLQTDDAAAQPPADDTEPSSDGTMATKPSGVLNLPIRLNLNVFAREDPLARHLRLQAEEDAIPSKFELLAAGFSKVSGTAGVYRGLRRHFFSDRDDDFHFLALDSKTQDALAEGIPFDMQEPLNYSRSMAHAELIAGQILGLIKSQQILEDAGMAGFVARVAAVILDIPFIAAVTILALVIRTKRRRAARLQVIRAKRTAHQPF